MSDSNEGFASASMTAGQLNSVVKCVGGKNAAMSLLTDQELQKAVAKQIADWKKKPAVATYLTSLFVDETIMLPATDGAVTLADSSDVFPGFLDADLRIWNTDKPGEQTEPRVVTVLEQVKNGKIRQMFESLGPLDRSVMSQGQIASFCVAHRDKLRQEGWGTFFLFKVGAEYFVAHVDVGCGAELRLYVNRLDVPVVWYAGDRVRVVVPQQDA